jgi:hypothetical protein
LPIPGASSHLRDVLAPNEGVQRWIDQGVHVVTKSNTHLEGERKRLINSGHAPHGKCRDRDDSDAADSDPKVVCTDSHADSDRENDVRRVLGVSDDRSEPDNRERTDGLKARATLSPITCVTIAMRIARSTSVTVNEDGGSARLRR